MKKTLLLAAATLIVVALGFWGYQRVKGNDESPYRLATIERGDLQATVSATGALQAVTTVEVGTQVSGQITAIYVDFNDEVKQGQLIARIDPILHQQAVREAEANLERSRAELDRAKREYDRNKQLFDNKVLTEVEFNSAKYAYEVAQANAKSAAVSLERARRNLEYTAIYSPIDGVVIERNVSVGQTVTASMSTPKLFVIANDLSQMQILASVDESDIGLIKKDQPVRFTVQAYPNETFTGNVQQVRLQSTTQENVVNYTVVIDVENPTGKLLPGMTATVDFLTGMASDALLVPNAALRFRPTAEMLAELRKQRESKGATGKARAALEGGSTALESDSNARTAGGMRMARLEGQGQAVNGQGTRSPSADGTGMSSGRETGRSRPRDMATLWILDASGKPAPVPVRTGITDGQRTEVSSPRIKEGMQVIVGLTSGSSTSQAPFQMPPGPGQGGMRGIPRAF